MSIIGPLRILSDLHFGHPAGLVENLEQLTPLFEGVKTVVFNGDTVEMRFAEDRPAARCNVARIGELCVAAGARPIFVNGNHDPIVSSIDHLDLAGGGVLVTHGDFLFHEVSPWSPEGQQIGRRHTEVLQGLGEESFSDFEARLRAGKQASLAVETYNSDLPRGLRAKWNLILRELWPPWKPFYIARVWKVTPDRAVALARVFRPRARIICIGHVHRCGIWRRDPRVVVNTGSFMPLCGRLAVEVDGEYLDVREVESRGGRFRLGRLLDRFYAGRLHAHEGY